MLNPKPFLSRARIPNFLAVLRIVLTAPIIFCLFLESEWFYGAGAVLWLCAGLTDFLDGYLARKWGVQSAAGAFLDLTADKILSLSVMVFLVWQRQLNPILVILFMVRDVYIMGLRSAAAQSGRAIEVKTLGKWKTAGETAGVFCVLAALAIGGASYKLWPDLLKGGGVILLWLSVFLSYMSAFIYTKEFYQKTD